ncbi:diguanylate cyclase [Aestuariibacter sp. A3R04]|nr:diguanylate cyclase [Aestuariibacter sp. A3R04]
MLLGLSLLLSLCFLRITVASPLSKDSNVIRFSDYHHRTWTTRHDMPQISAVGIAQDMDGFIWVATEGGLARFDGYKFTTFNASQSPVFTDPILRTLLVDDENRLWVGSADGLLVKEEKTFSRIDYNNRSIGKVEALAIFNGRVYAGANGLYVVEKGEREVSLLSPDEKQVTQLLSDDDRLWVALSNRLYYLDIHQDLYEVPALRLPDNTQITELLRYQGDLLIGTTGGLFELQSDGTLVRRNFEGADTSGVIQLLYEDASGALWISVDQCLLQIAGNVIIDRIDKLPDNTRPWYVTAFEDSSGHLWLGSKSHGLQRLRYDGTRNLGVEAGLGEPYVWSFLATEQGMIVGGNDGLYRLKNGRFSPLINDTSVLPNKVVYSLFQDSNNSIWLGTRSGAVTLNSDFEVVNRFPSLRGGQVNGFSEDHNNHIWIATLKGLYRFDGETLTNETERFNLASESTRTVHTDQYGVVWVGTARGLYRIEGDMVSNFADNPILGVASITHINELDDGRLIVGTFQHGFAVQQGDGWRILEAGKLPAEGTLFAAQHRDELLVSTLKGMYSLPVKDLASGGELNPTVIIDDHGPESTIDGIRCCNGAGNGKGFYSDDVLYLPTLNGVGVVELNSTSQSYARPLPVIEGVEVNGHWYRGNDIRLPQGERNLRFEYSSPLYYRNGAVRFRYRLIGYDKAWTQTSVRREAFYTNLPAGNYTFELQTRLAEETQWSAADTLSLTIPALWFEQYWTRMLIALLLVCLVWGVLRIRTRSLQRIRARLERMVDERTVELDNANRKLEEANRRLETASMTDALTGLKNRHYLDVYIENIIARTQRSQLGLYYIILDIDDFKILNDEMGHAVGDEILVHFSHLLTKATRSTDHVIRWGGEEFLVLLDGSMSVDVFLERLMSLISSTTWPFEAQLPKKPSCSAGVCFHLTNKADSWTTSHSLILADKAMYLVKRFGKAGWLELIPSSTLPDDILTKVTKGKPERLVACDYFEVRGSVHILQALSQINDNVVPFLEKQD